MLKPLLQYKPEYFFVIRNSGHTLYYYWLINRLSVILHAKKWITNPKKAFLESFFPTKNLVDFLSVINEWNRG